ncbi:MAG: futalosine hydrolase [Bacteroidetes bacterium]|nr:futalosine hydrolase [Bacteroidota bacterium]
MRVFISAATMGEWMPCFSKIDKLYTEQSSRLKIYFHESGVGMLASCFSLAKLAIEEKPDLIIQVGVAGCFDNTVKPGKVVVVNKEYDGNTGVEENGKWCDIFNIKLEKPNYHPYQKRALPNPHIEKLNLLQLKAVTGITVNEITTRKDRIKQLVKKYNPFIETMEGAALHFVCRSTGTAFLQVRAISNYVGERDKTRWVLKDALYNLNDTLIQYIDKLYKIA